MVSRVVSNAVWSPWRELARFQNEVGRMLHEPIRPNASSDGPAFNIYRNDRGSVITAELPGIDASSLEISVSGDVVTIQGKRVAEANPETARVQRRERNAGEFKRTLKLPYRIDAGKTEAVYQLGVLSVTLPSVQDEKPHQIVVKSV
ncbi:MAG: heat shock protein Hsp20 family protein [Planctomycetaceae bacterium]|nr:heat shock protein Hsp20 family protein [Planctomycetaceae bacterium]